MQVWVLGCKRKVLQVVISEKINAAFSAVPEISNISPQILINGLKTSLITSFTGGIIMLISTALWYFFIKRHNLLVV